jgi:hypothetical protein
MISGECRTLYDLMILLCFRYRWYVPFTYMTQEDNEPKLQWLKMGPGKSNQISYT